MEQLNKYVLVAMNPRSTQEELFKNSNDAYSAATASSTATAYAVTAYVDYVDYVDYVGYDYGKKYLNRYFKITGENIQDYYDEIERINKDKQ